MDNEKFTNQKRLVHVRNAYGKWKQYKIVFENETHWDRWIEKMWSWDYKLECVYTYVDCKACGKEHIKGECFDTSPPFEWTDELVLEFAKVTTQGGYGEYRGCKSVQSKLERFKLVSSRTLKLPHYKIYDTQHNIYVSLHELNPDLYEAGRGKSVYDSKEEILHDLKEFHMEYGEDVTLEDLCREYGWRVDSC